MNHKTSAFDKNEKPAPRKLHGKPLGSTILVKRLEDEELAGSLIARPESAKRASDEVEILATGPGVTDVQVGDHCLLRRYSGVGTEIKYDGVDYVIVSMEDLLLVLPAA